MPLNGVIPNTQDVETAVVECEVMSVWSKSQPPIPPSAADQSPLPVSGSGRLDLRAITRVVREAGPGTRCGLEDLALDEGLSLDGLNISLVLRSDEAVREPTEAGAGATYITSWGCVCDHRPHSDSHSGRTAAA